MARRYLLDTGPAFDFLFRRRDVESRVEKARRLGGKIGICSPVLGEIIGGLEGSKSREISWDIVRRRLGKLVLWPYDKAAANEYGIIFADLKRRGRPMQQIDIQLAAVAQALGNCVVVSSDSDLLAVTGIKVENWSLSSDGN